MQRKALIVGGAGGPDQEVNSVLQRFGFGPAAAAASVPEAASRLRDEHFDLLVVPLQDMDAVDLATLEREIRRATSTFVIGTAAEANADLILRAMRSGIHEFVHFPPDARDLTAAVDRLLQRSQTAAAQGLTVAVYSAKGGLGTTSVAINLAYGFARNDPKSRVALVDFVVAGGDVAVMLDLHPTYDVSDLAIRTNQIDAELLKSTLTAAPGGVWVLPAGDKPEVSDLVDASAASTIIAQLGASFGFTVIDCEHYLTDRTLAALDAADRVVLVTQLSIAALRSTQRTIQLCRRLGYPDDRLYVVANRYQSADVVSTEDAAQVLERQVYYKIPNDYRTSVAALTKGQAVSQYDVKSTLAVSYAGLAAKLAGGTSAASDANGTDTTSRLGRLLGRGRK
jgi:pilus assembly protein CpaE